jgi:cell division protein FtsL
MAIAPKDTSSHRMWFAWPLTVWEKIFFFVTAAAAVLGAVSLMSAFASAIIGYKISDVVTRDASIKIADANARQKEAEEKIEKLNQKI